MAEISYLWTTSGTGDGSAGGYTQADLSVIMEVVAACNGNGGVAIGYGSELLAAANGANSVRVPSGGGLVDGKPYSNSGNVDVNIPSAVGAGNTRIDRIVLRASWAAQTVRITRIAGTDAASPSVPVITQTSGTTYDIMLCQVLVDTSGAVTVTDERVWAETALRNNSVTNAMFRDSVAVSVIGRSANSSGDPADIAATANGQVLKRTGDALTFAQIADADIANSAVTTNKIADGNVTNSKLAANAVTADKIQDGSVAAAELASDAVETAKIKDANVTGAKIAADTITPTNLGAMVPALLGRQGGSATRWGDSGTTNYTSGLNVRMQCGTFAVDASGNGTVTFPVAFSAEPVVLATFYSNNGNAMETVEIYGVEADHFHITAWHHYNDQNPAKDGYATINWLAIGPE